MKSALPSLQIISIKKDI